MAGVELKYLKDFAAFYVSKHYLLKKPLVEGLMLEMKLKLQYFGHLIRKDSDAGKDWGQEEKRATEDEMVGWCHWLNGRKVKQTLGRQWRTGKPGVVQSTGLQSQTWLRD